MKPRFIRLVQDSLLVMAEEQPDHVALVTGGKRYTYRELRDAALSFAQCLLERGLERGDRVAIYHDNGWPAIVAIFGTLLADGVFLVINPQTKTEKLEYVLLDSGARFLITQFPSRRNFLPALSYVKELRQVFVSGRKLAETPEELPTLERFEDVIEAMEPQVPPKRSVSVDLASLVYTSGSTGSPKGVMMTHQSMVFITESLIEYLRLDHTHRILGMLPLAFDYGLYQLFMAVRCGATLVLERNFTYPTELIARIRDEEITVFPGVPTLYAMLISMHDKKKLEFPSVQRVTNTAAALPKAFQPKLEEIFPNALIFKMYGLTECKRVAYLEPELVHEKPDSVGKAIPGTEVFLVSPEGGPVPPGGMGILHVRGAHVMLGYWNQPVRSARMLEAGQYPYERVLNTTDWFRMDEQGFLYFEGRSDDIIKTRGEKVSPVEVENVLYGIEGVREAAVIGVEDPLLGQAIHAYLALDEDATLTENEIKKACLQHLEDFMVPQQVIFIDELSKSENGKIRKQSLIEETRK